MFRHFPGAEPSSTNQDEVRQGSCDGKAGELGHVVGSHDSSPPLRPKTRSEGNGKTSSEARAVRMLFLEFLYVLLGVLEEGGGFPRVVLSGVPFPLDLVPDSSSSPFLRVDYFFYFVL